jgi:hypothetical protein
MPAMIGDRPMTKQQIHKRWRERNPGKLKEMGASYYQQNKEKCTAATMKWRAANIDKVKARVKEYNKKYRSEHMQEHRDREKRRRDADPAKYRESQLIKNFGITSDQYNALLLSQDGVCAICKRLCKSGRNLAVDHCHATGLVRGLLCTKCNTAIGALDEREDLMLSAIDYLKKAYKS